MDGLSYHDLCSYRWGQPRRRFYSMGKMPEALRLCNIGVDEVLLTDKLKAVVRVSIADRVTFALAESSILLSITWLLGDPNIAATSATATYITFGNFDTGTDLETHQSLYNYLMPQPQNLQIQSLVSPPELNPRAYRPLVMQHAVTKRRSASLKSC